MLFKQSVVERTVEFSKKATAVKIDSALEKELDTKINCSQNFDISADTYENVMLFCLDFVSSM